MVRKQTILDIKYRIYMSSSYQNRYWNLLKEIKAHSIYVQYYALESELTLKLSEISLEIEKHWYSVAEGELTEKEIHNLCIEFHDKSMRESNKILKNITLPVKKRILKKAEIETDKYLVNFYT